MRSLLTVGAAVALLFGQALSPGAGAVRAGGPSQVDGGGSAIQPKVATRPGLIAFNESGSRLGIMTATTSGHVSVIYPTGSNKVLESPSWAPDGLELAFVRAFFRGAIWEQDIVVTNRNGKVLFTPLKITDGLTTGESINLLDWSPDGSKIAYTCREEICILDVVTGQHHLLTDPNDSWTVQIGLSRISWSPKGDVIAFAGLHPVTCDPGSPPGTVCQIPDIALADATTGAITQLTDDYAMAPDFSPDGKQIVYYDPGPVDGHPLGVALMNADGSNRHLVVPMQDAGLGAGNDGEPTWSPDGKKILFQSGRLPNTQYFGLYTVSAAHPGAYTPLAVGNIDDDNPSWAPPAPACTIMGTNKADNLKGTSGADVICGLEGDDTIHGNGGNDTVVGGPGNDKLYGDAGDDTILGEDGNDTLTGGAGKDSFSGGEGADTLNAKDGVKGELVDGGPGIDVCNADKGDIKKNCP